MALTKVTGQVIKNTTHVTVGVLTVTNTLAVGGTVSIGGTLTYEDVTNIDSVGLITARNGIVVGSGITLSKDGDIFATGVTTSTTFSGNFSGGTVAGSTGTFSDAVTIVKSSGPLLELTTNTSAADATLRLSEGATGSTSNGGGMFYSGADNKLHITCGTDSTTKRITINRDDGKIGIGTASPATDVHTLSSSDHIITHQTGTSGADVRMNFRDNSSVDQGGIHYAFNGNSMRFRTAQGERLRIDSSGNLLLGTTTSSENLRLAEKFAIVGVDVAYPGMNITEYNNTSASHGPIIDFQRSRSTTDGGHTIVQSGDKLGEVIFRGADGNGFSDSSSIRSFVDTTPGDGDMPGRLTFSTAADGSTTLTERMRIDRNGHVTKPTNLCLSYTANASTDFTSGTIIYNTLVFDVNSSGAYNTSTGVFTAPVVGMYLIYHEYYALSNNKAMTEIQKSTNGGGSFSAIKYTTRVQGSSSDYSGASNTFFAQLNANDQIKIARREGTIHINNTYTHFQVQLIQ